MKSRILIAAALAVLVVPAASFASAPTGQDRENGARACRALRVSMTPDVFRQAYGTAKANRKNAFGRCVSQWTRAEQQARISARSECATEKADPNFALSHDGKSFDEVYGTGLEAPKRVRQVRLFEGEDRFDRGPAEHGERGRDLQG